MERKRDGKSCRLSGYGVSQHHLSLDMKDLNDIPLQENQFDARENVDCLILSTNASDPKRRIAFLFSRPPFRNIFFTAMASLQNLSSSSLDFRAQTSAFHCKNSLETSSTTPSPSPTTATASSRSSTASSTPRTSSIRSLLSRLVLWLGRIVNQKCI